MSSNYNNNLFQPKINGNVSFRQQTIRLNDENGVAGKTMMNMNKSSIVEETSQREFGKDLTNLTIYNVHHGGQLGNQENLNPNLRKSQEMAGVNQKLISVKNKIKY